MAKYTDAMGTRVMRSTKHTDRKLAKLTADEWEASAKLARRRELTQAASVKVLDRLMEQTIGDRLVVTTISEVFNGFLQSREKLGRTASTAIRYKPIIANFLATLGDKRCAAAASSLTAREIEKWRDAEVVSGKAPKTVNFGLSVISAALTVAHRKSEILSNPALGVERVVGRGEERAPFTDAEIKSLLIAAEGTEWETAILVGVWTGLRLSDIARLTWANINLTEHLIRVTTEKTDKDIAVALSGELQDHLVTLPMGVGKGALMPSLAGRVTGGNSKLGGLSNEFKRLMKRANVIPELGVQKKGKGRRVSTKSFHSLRHSFVTRCVEGGTSDAVTKSMSGHTTDSAFLRYVHLGVEKQREALARLPKLAGL